MITSVRVVGENWANIDDRVERRRAQNRIAQRGYRKRLKKEKRGEGKDTSASIPKEEAEPKQQRQQQQQQQQPPHPQQQQQNNLHTFQPSAQLHTPPDVQLFSPPIDAMPFPESWTPPPMEGPHPLQPVMNAQATSFSATEGEYTITTTTNRHKNHSNNHDLSNPHHPGFPMSATSPSQPTPSVTPDPHPTSVAIVDPVPPRSIPAGVPSQENTALHRAALYGHECVLDVLLCAGADASIADSAGLTPLHLAALQGHARLVTLLLESSTGSGVDVNGVTREGETALHLAVKHNRPEVVKALLCAGRHQSVLVDAQDWVGRTALHHACERNRRDLVEMLLQAGAQLEIRDLEGQTPLHTACLGGEHLAPILRSAL